MIGQSPGHSFTCLGQVEFSWITCVLITYDRPDRADVTEEREVALLDRPETIPRLRPVAEHQADAELAETYADVKRTLGVPWVGVVVQAFAHYRSWFDRWWASLRPMFAAHYTERAAADLRLLAWRGVAEHFEVTDQAAVLRDSAGYSDRELDEIRGVLDVFDYGNPKYFLLASAAKAALMDAGPREDLPPLDLSEVLPRSPVMMPLVPAMLEEHHVSGSLRELYAEMKSALGLPFVNSDYKAMARWPTYLEVAWADLKPALVDERYAELRDRLNEHCLDAARRLTGRVPTHRGELRALGMPEAEIDELFQVVRLFQWLLSGLILNVTHFRIGLNGGSTTAATHGNMG